jgi:hypothetical protein
MQRRDFLRAGLGLAASALIPSWWLARGTPAVVDLSAFCALPGYWGGSKFTLDRPFVQAGGLPVFGESWFRYGTDARICVRIPSDPQDRQEDNVVNLPPASGLPWQHDRLKGWKPWPKSEPLVAVNSYCLECRGNGVIVPGIPEECPDCEGMGWSMDSNPWSDRREKCATCHGLGCLGPLCPVCQGDATGTRPGIQRVGAAYIGLDYDRKVRRHLRDVEYALGEVSHERGPVHAVYLRFTVGEAILMPLDPEQAERRIREAKGAES